MSASVPGAMLGVTATKSVPGTGRGSARRTCSVRTRLTPTSQVAAFGAIGTATTKTGARFGHHPKFHRPHLAFTARRFIRPAAAKAEDLPVSFLDDEQWNDVVANANASEGGDDEDGAAMASNSDYAAGESNLEYDRSFAVWICMAVSAVVYSVPFGFVRWNLSSLAPLVWWQLGLSTAVGTAMAMPLIAAITKPAATHDVNFPIFARASFGVRGALFADLGRGTLGLFLFTLITLVGGEALVSLLSAICHDGIAFDGIIANPSTFLGGVERAVAYLAFWSAQLLLALLGPDKRLMVCARAAAISVFTLAFKTVVDGIHEANALGATSPTPIPPVEFWAHAVLTAGVWFTLSAMLPDYARRAVNVKSFLKAQAVWLPVLAGCAAVAASGVATSPAVLCLPVVLVACLVTNAIAASVGPVASIRAIKPMSGKSASLVLALVALIAAPIGLTWQQVIASASWVIGIGSLLVAPAIGVMLADFWVTQKRSIQKEDLCKGAGQTKETSFQTNTTHPTLQEKRGDKYWYRNGVHVRAIVCALVGASPNLISLFGNLAAVLRSTGETRLDLYVVNSEYSSLLGALLAGGVYLLSFQLNWLKPYFIKFLIFVVQLPSKVTDFGTTRVQKRLGLANAKRYAANGVGNAEEWITEFRRKQGLTANPATVRALRTIGTGDVAKAMTLSQKKRASDAQRAMEIAMNKPEVVAARAAVAAAKKAAEQAVLKFEEAQMMPDGAKRDAAVTKAEQLVTEKFTLKVTAEMAYETAVFKYTKTIVTTTYTKAVQNATTTKTSAAALVEASQSMDAVTKRTDGARLERRRERAALETEKAKLAATQKALEAEAAALEREQSELADLERVEREFGSSVSSSSSSSSTQSASMTSSQKTSATSTTTTSTTTFSNEGEGVSFEKVEYTGLPGYVIPLLLFGLFTAAVVEGLGDVFHL